MFFDTFTALCNQKGVSPTKATLDCGASKSGVSYWKNGGIPSTKILNNMAKYFNVSVDYLLENDIPELINGDKELTEYLEDLRNRPEMRMLFSITSTCTKEEVEQAVRIIEALRNGK